MKWYTLDKILKHNTPYYFIIGQRSNGKTYSALKYAIENYINNGERAVYVRRWDTDLKGIRATRVAMQVEEILGKMQLPEKKYDGCMFSKGAWYFYKNKTVRHRNGTEDTKQVKEEKPFMFAMALNNMEHDKGGNMNTDEANITTMIFDEAVTRMRYLPDELSIFTDTVSTIKRRKNNLKIFLLANTVSKYCPYFKYFGIEFTPNMKQGDIRENKNKTVTVERTEDNAEQVEDKYFQFDNKTVGMITHGKWEIADYPKITTKWKRSDVLMDLFVFFDNQYMHGELVNKEGNIFLFFYPKYDLIHDENKDIVFSDVPDYRRNWYQSLIKPRDDISKLVAKTFADGKVFYSDNDTGELLRNFVIQNVLSVSAKYRSM